MSAFDALEQRIIDLSMRGVQDSAEAVVVVGLFRPTTTDPATGAVTSAPMPENHDGTYGQAGEPAASGVAGTGYRRSRATFGTAGKDANGVTRILNTDPVTLTGLPAGTYTHFGVFGSSSAGQG